MEENFAWLRHVLRLWVTLCLAGYAIGVRAQSIPCPGDTARWLPIPTLNTANPRGSLALFERYVYGKMPPPPSTFRIISRHTARALSGKALRVQTALEVVHGGGLRDTLHVLLYLPSNAAKPVPVLLGLNFYGNQSISTDTGIALPTHIIGYERHMGLHKGYATDSSRGRHAHRWPIAEAIARGYAVATLCCAELYPDFNGPGARSQSVLRRTPDADSTAPGAIAAWAWGLRQAVSYLRTERQIDTARISIVGHSRLGKAALLAGAMDTRIALVAANCAGELGASLSHHLAGEDVAYLWRKFPYWFCPRLGAFAQGNPLPIDQHQLIAAIAPRRVLISSATQDAWADPPGEYAALRLAAPAWGQTLPHCPPSAGKLQQTGPVAYYLRTGRHDINLEVWQKLMAFEAASHSNQSTIRTPR